MPALDRPNSGTLRHLRLRAIAVRPNACLISTAIVCCFLLSLMGPSARASAATRSAVLLKDINPGPDSSQARGFTTAHGIAYFQAADASHGTELWRSDGTKAGTRLVKDIAPGSRSSYPDGAVAVRNGLFFSATSGRGRGLWKSDGSASGTRLVRAFPARHGVAELTPLGRSVFFVAGSFEDLELWRSDGTRAGTVQLTTPDADPSTADQAGKLTVMGGSLYYVFDGDLWKVGETGRPTLIKPDCVFNIGPPMSVAGDDLYFIGYDDVHGGELWRSDGTTAGTGLVVDLTPASLADGSPVNSSIDWLTTSGGRAFFTARTQGEFFPPVWTSDGTAAGTTMLQTADGGHLENLTSSLSLGGPNAIATSAGVYLSVYDGRLVGNSLVDYGALWRTDGTPAGTTKIRSFRGYSPDLMRVGSQIYYTRDRALWSVQGLAVKRVARVDDPPDSSLAGFARVRGKLLFDGEDSRHGAELWVVRVSP